MPTIVDGNLTETVAQQTLHSLVRQSTALQTDLVQSGVLAVAENVGKVVINVPTIIFFIADLKKRLTDLYWEIQAWFELVGATGQLVCEYFFVMKTMSGRKQHQRLGGILFPNCLFN